MEEQMDRERGEHQELMGQLEERSIQHEKRVAEMESRLHQRDEELEQKTAQVQTLTQRLKEVDEKEQQGQQQEATEPSEDSKQQEGQSSSAKATAKLRQAKNKLDKLRTQLAEAQTQAMPANDEDKVAEQLLDAMMMDDSSVTDLTERTFTVNEVVQCLDSYDQRQKAVVMEVEGSRVRVRYLSSSDTQSAQHNTQPIHSTPFHVQLLTHVNLLVGVVGVGTSGMTRHPRYSSWAPTPTRKTEVRTTHQHTEE
jgi:chromosome segregation ATPase